MQTKRARLKHGPQQRRTIALEKKEKKRPSRIYTQEQIFYFFYNYYVTWSIQCLACVCIFNQSLIRIIFFLINRLLYPRYFLYMKSFF